jgi:hypothetical protein
VNGVDVILAKATLRRANKPVMAERSGRNGRTMKEAALALYPVTPMLHYGHHDGDLWDSVEYTMNRKPAKATSDKQKPRSGLICGNTKQSLSLDRLYDRQINLLID